MKPKTMILLMLAIGCGLGASYMTSRLLAEREVPEEEKVTLLVARKDMPTGTSVMNPTDMFVPKEFTVGQEPKGAITTFDQLKGRVLKQALREGDHIRPEDLMNDKDAWMSYLLPKGYRAIGLRVNIEDIAGGFASLPLSRVDIISTIRRGNDKDSYSQTLLQNVLVLAADQTIHADTNKGAMPATTVTVALTPEEAQKVTLARQMGTLSLALRSFEDRQKVEVAKTTVEGLLGGANKSDETMEFPSLPVVPDVPPEPKKTEEPAAPMPEAPKFRTHVVTVINGSRQELIEYRLDENDRVISSRVVQREGEITPPPRVDTPPAVTPPANGELPGNPPAAPPKLDKGTTA